MKNIYKKYIFETDKNEIENLSQNPTIKTVNNIIEFKKFIIFSFKLYKNNSNGVASFCIEYKEFFKKKNPFWKHAELKLFIAYKNDEIVGHIAAIVDHFYCNLSKEKIGFFGFFEFIDDYKSAQKWFILKGIIKMQGSINGRIYVGCGFLYEGFNLSQSLLSSYSPEYYISFAEKFDIKKARDFLIYYIDLKKPISNKLLEKAQKCAASDIKIRPFNRLHTQKELKWWIKFFLECFAYHWRYVPVSEDEVRSRFGVKQMRWFVEPRLFIIAEHNNSPVAFIWFTTDYNQIFQKMNRILGLFHILPFLIKKQQINKKEYYILWVLKKSFVIKI